MPNDKLKITRRRALAGLGVVGGASAGAGAGTLALFSDSETSSGNTVQAGTLDLVIDGDDQEVTLIDTSDVKPGDSGQGRTTLKNDGSIPGFVDISVSSVRKPENGLTEPESNVDTTGNARGTFALDFSEANDAASAGSTSPGWVTDRTEPTAWETTSFDGDSRLRIEIGELSTSGFDDYVGKKYIPGTDAGQWNAGDGSRITYQFYVDPSWEENDDSHESGVWIVGGDGNVENNIDSNRTDYSILHYQDSSASESGSARFRYFDGGGTNSGEWIDVGLPSGFDPVEGGWVDIEYVFKRDRDEHRWYVNGDLLHRDTSIGSGTDVIYRPIINSVNFDSSKSKEYYYDNFSLSTAGNGELGDALKMRAYFDEGGTKSYIVGDSSTYVSLLDAFSAATDYDTDYRLDSTESANFVIDWRIPETAGNEIQSDGVSVDFVFELEQNKTQ